MNSNSKKEAIFTACLFGTTVGFVVSCLVLVSGVFVVETSLGQISALVGACVLPFSVLGAQFGARYWKTMEVKESSHSEYHKHF